VMVRWRLRRSRLFRILRSFCSSPDRSSARGVVRGKLPLARMTDPKNQLRLTELIRSGERSGRVVKALGPQTTANRLSIGATNISVVPSTILMKRLRGRTGDWLLNYTLINTLPAPLLQRKGSLTCARFRSSSRRMRLSGGFEGGGLTLNRVVKNDFLLRISIVGLQLCWSRRKIPQRISVDTPPVFSPSPRLSSKLSKCSRRNHFSPPF